MTEGPAAVSTLAILPSADDRARLHAIYQRSDWNLHLTHCLEDARVMMRQVGAGVVICDRSLPDGEWKDVLEELRRQPLEPSLIVCCRLADERLWSEVLNLGGIDVLATPFDATEVLRSTGLAWRQWRDRCNGTQKTGLKVRHAS